VESDICVADRSDLLVIKFQECLTLTPPSPAYSSFLVNGQQLPVDPGQTQAAYLSAPRTALLIPIQHSADIITDIKVYHSNSSPNNTQYCPVTDHWLAIGSTLVAKQLTEQLIPLAVIKQPVQLLVMLPEQGSTCTGVPDSTPVTALSARYKIVYNTVHLTEPTKVKLCSDPVVPLNATTRLVQGCAQGERKVYVTEYLTRQPHFTLPQLQPCLEEVTFSTLHPVAQPITASLAIGSVEVPALPIIWPVCASRQHDWTLSFTPFLPPSNWYVVRFQPKWISANQISLLQSNPVSIPLVNDTNLLFADDGTPETKVFALDDLLHIKV
jgi:hypothetical protein